MRRPRLDYESHAVALDGNELGALLVATGLGPPPEHALVSMLALNGLGVDTTVEMGGNKVLTGMMRRIDKDIQAVALDTPAEIEAFV